MIKKKIEDSQFTLELTVKFKDPRCDEAYGNAIKGIASLLACGLTCGHLFPLFMEEIRGASSRMLVALQVEEALSKPSGS